MANDVLYEVIKIVAHINQNAGREFHRSRKCSTSDNCKRRMYSFFHLLIWHFKFPWLSEINVYALWKKKLAQIRKTAMKFNKGKGKIPVWLSHEYLYLWVFFLITRFWSMRFWNVGWIQKCFEIVQCFKFSAPQRQFPEFKFKSLELTRSFTWF